LEAVSQAAAALDVPYVIVGAAARDLVLHYGHGAPIQRATADIDFAIEVPSWAAFAALQKALCERGFKATKAQHRMISPTKDVVDILPFGDIEDEHAIIAWPPKGDITMNVLGFQEACSSAQRVRILDRPEVDVPVATPVGMIVLKLMAWVGRDRVARRKDALDIAYLLSSYESIREVQDTLYSDKHGQAMNRYDWDITQAAAHLLGEKAKDIAQTFTEDQIVRLARGQLKGRALDRLVEEMCEHIDAEHDRNQQLLAAFLAGFGADV